MSKTIDYSRSAYLFARQKAKKMSRLRKEENTQVKTIDHEVRNSYADCMVLPSNMFPCRRTLKRITLNRASQITESGRKKSQKKGISKEMSYVSHLEFEDTRLFRLK